MMNSLKPLALVALAPLAGLALSHNGTLHFEAVVDGEPLACGTPYDNVGSAGSSIIFQDARFYVSNVRLLTADGNEVPFELEQDGLWQHENVALLDFEDGTAGCQDVGTAETNTALVGSADGEDFTGIAFDLGVPFALNHNDTTTAPTPLNLTSMYWSWQGGYKFVRIEVVPQHGDRASAEMGEADDGHGGMAPAGLWPFHLGSTGCDSPAPVVAPESPCSRPNMSTIRLEGFDPENDTVTLDIAALFEGVDVSQSLELEPPGCMSGFDDPDCTVIFENVGLALETGHNDHAQKLFSVTKGDAKAAHASQ